MSQAWRPFILPSETRRKAIETVLTAEIVTWCKDWRVEPTAPTPLLITETSASAIDGLVEWMSYTLRGEDSACIFVRKNWDRQSLAATVVEASHAQMLIDSVDDLVWSVIDEARGDLLARCLSILAHSGCIESGATHSLPSTTTELTGGYITINNKALCLLIVARMPTALTSSAGASSPLALVSKAIDRQRLRLTATLGSSQLSLQDILSLKTGDVVCMDTPLSQPLSLSGPDGIPIAKANLGRIGERIAVSVADTYSKQNNDPTHNSRN